jgi:hypothetical protein
MQDKTGPSQADLLIEPAIYLPLAAARRRNLLNAGVASRAIAALPAAMSLGIALATPAQAQHALGNSTTGVDLTTGVNNNYRSFTITSATTITNAGNGVYGGSVTLGNAGSVASSGGNGVDTTGASTVSNTGTILGGTTGGDYGVKLNAGPSTLKNTGVIAGYIGASANDGSTIYNGVNGTIGGNLIGVLQGQVNPVAPGTVINKGIITESDATGQGAVVMQGGYFHNYAGAKVISNADGLFTYDHAINAENSGTIVANGGPTTTAYGIAVSAGGTITNTDNGSIFGNTAGIVVNANTVAIDNQAGATLAGGGFGIYLGVAESFTNSGTIEQTATSVSQLNPGTLGTNFSAIYLKNGGEFTNSATAAVIGAEFGVRSDNAATTISNFGSISGVQAAIYLRDGGGITNASTGTITSAHVAVYNDGAIASLGNSGLIDGNVYGIRDAAAGSIGALVNASGGTITGGLTDIRADGTIGTLTNNGVLTGGEYGIGDDAGGTIAAIINTGSITGSNSGLYNDSQIGTLANTGVITGTAYDAFHNLGTIGTLENLAGGTLYGNNNAMENDGSIGLISNAASASIGSLDFGIQNTGTIAQIENAGVIYGARFEGIYNASGTIGPITNSGTIAGSIAGIYSGPTASIGGIANSGLITGTTFGIGIAGGPGIITNSGSIEATGGTAILFADGGDFINSGAIGGTTYGVEISGGLGDVANSGNITASSGTGVLLADGGLVTNSAGGFISGQYGVELSAGGSLLNSGSINGASVGALLTNVTSLSNAAGAAITGGQIGIEIMGAPLSFANAGSIGSSSGTALALFDGGTLTNLSTGSITAGGQGVYISGGIGSLSNAGVITASGFGAELKSGGFVSNASGGVITGLGEAGVYIKGASAQNTDGSLVNSGVISGGTIGVDIRYGSSVVNAAGASIFGSKNGVFAEGSPITVTNSGSIGSTTGAGVDLAAGGVVINLSTGTITGGSNGVYITGGLGSVVNTGTISATGGRAVLLEDGGVIVNQGVVINAGSIGVAVTTAAGTIDNKGTIASNVDSAVLFDAGGTVVNEAGRVIIGATYGIHATGGDSNITNYGSIIATSGTGVDFSSGILVNEQGAVIAGDPYGLSVTGAATVMNAGLIMDAGTAGAVIGSNVTFNNAITGTISGTTGLEFTGDGSTVINAGTIASTAVGGDAVSFSAAGVNFLTLTSGQLLIGTVDGGGSDSQIALDGTGTLTNTITDFGTSSSLDVAPAADWTAYGTWQIATATNDGVFQPGIIGTPLSLTGNFVQDPAGTLRVIVTPDATSQLLITGSATLNGGLIYNFAPGTYVPKVFPFITTTGGTTGGFTTVTYNQAPANLLHATTYADNNANLVLYDQGTAAPPNTTPATPIIVSPDDTGIFSDENQQSALNAQAANASLLEKAAEGDQEGAEAAVCASEAGTTPADVEPDKVTRTARLATAVANAFCGAGGWIQGSGTVFNADGSATVDGYQADTAGFLAGIDKALNAQGTRLGIAVGYDESSIKTGLGSKGTVDTTRVGLFASQPVGVFTLAADIMYGHFDTTTSRVTGIGEAGSKSSGNIFSGGFEAETLMPIGVFDIIPSAGIRFASVSAGSFRESAPGAEQAFAVNGAGSGYDSVQPFVNIDASTRVFTPNNIAITPDVSVGYIYEAGTRARAVTVDSQDGTTFESSHLGLAGSAADLEAGLSAGKGNWAFYARYTADIGGNWTSQTGEAGLRIRF